MYKTQMKKIKKTFQKLCKSMAAQVEMHFTLDDLPREAEVLLKRQSLEKTSQKATPASPATVGEASSSAVAKKRMSLEEYIERKKQNSEDDFKKKYYFHLFQT